MRKLKIGMSGPDVEQWQIFLTGQNFQPGEVDGDFGPATSRATRKFQMKVGLAEVDGIVGEKTLAKAALSGFVAKAPATKSPGQTISALPTPTPELRQALFGYIKYVHAPVRGNPENINIVNGWNTRNIETVKLKQLTRVEGAPRDVTINFHRKGRDQLVALWKAWDEAGLLGRVLTWHGSYVPRFIRGSRRTLSSHAYGSAFDINLPWNRLGARPAAAGRKGSVEELVKIANGLNFYWGGHFKGRCDGMHFELVKL